MHAFFKLNTKRHYNNIKAFQKNQKENNMLQFQINWYKNVKHVNFNINFEKIFVETCIRL